MPEPNKGEKEKDFISRCIPYVKDEHPDWDHDKHVAMCYDIWRRFKGSAKPERVLLKFCANLNFDKTINNLSKNDITTEIGRSTILVGGGTYNGVYFPVEELEKSFMTWDRRPINLDHSDKIEDTVGDIYEPMFDGTKITVRPHIEGYHKSDIAMKYILGRIKAGVVPEVSVGVWVDRVSEEIKGMSEPRVTARNLFGDHFAVISHGACSAEDGCGIGLSNANGRAITEYTNEPAHDSPGNAFTRTYESYIYDARYSIEKLENENKRLRKEIEIIKERIKGDK